MDRVATVAQYAPTATYPNTVLGSALRAVAGAIVRGIGTKVFWVQTAATTRTPSVQRPPGDRAYQSRGDHRRRHTAFYTTCRTRAPRPVRRS